MMPATAGATIAASGSAAAAELIMCDDDILAEDRQRWLGLGPP